MNKDNFLAGEMVFELSSGIQDVNTVISKVPIARKQCCLMC
jgi:hypothetical protein